MARRREGVQLAREQAYSPAGVGGRAGVGQGIFRREKGAERREDLRARGSTASGESGYRAIRQSGGGTAHGGFATGGLEIYRRPRM